MKYNNNNLYNLDNVIKNRITQNPEKMGGPPFEYIIYDKRTHM